MSAAWTLRSVRSRWQKRCGSWTRRSSSAAGTTRRTSGPSCESEPTSPSPTPTPPRKVCSFKFCHIFLAPLPYNFLSFISSPIDFHYLRLVTRWALLLITSNYCLPSTPKDRRTMRAEMYFFLSWLETVLVYYPWSWLIPEPLRVKSSVEVTSTEVRPWNCKYLTWQAAN